MTRLRFSTALRFTSLVIAVSATALAGCGSSADSSADPTTPNASADTVITQADVARLAPNTKLYVDISAKDRCQIGTAGAPVDPDRVVLIDHDEETPMQDWLVEARTPRNDAAMGITIQRESCTPWHCTYDFDQNIFFCTRMCN